MITQRKQFPNIYIDYDKCTTPFDCKICLRKCPQSCFEANPTYVQKFFETDKKVQHSFRVTPFYVDKCTMCMDCVNLCPVKAITVTLEPLENAPSIDTAKVGVPPSGGQELDKKQMLSFELDKTMLNMIKKEFDPKIIVEKFAHALTGKSKKESENIGREIFTNYGTDWIRRTHQLGEEYPDRTYQVLREAIDKTGGYYRFGLVPQRFLEIAYLGIMEFSSLPITACYSKLLSYRVPSCTIYNELQEQCGEEIAKRMPCKEACLTALRVLHRDLDLDAITGMSAEMCKDGYCELYAKKA